MHVSVNADARKTLAIALFVMVVEEGCNGVAAELNARYAARLAADIQKLY